VFVLHESGGRKNSLTHSHAIGASIGEKNIIGVSSMLLSETGYARAYKLLFVHVIVLAKKLAELPLKICFCCSGKNRFLITFLSLFISVPHRTLS
jgi:hypothetical protein